MRLNTLRGSLAVPLLITVLLASTLPVPAAAKIVRRAKKAHSETAEVISGALVFRSRGTVSGGGTLNFETTARLDANGIPLSASTRGRVKVFLFSAAVDLTLERVSGRAL